MKRTFVVVLIGLLLLGGFLTLQVVINGPNGALPGLRVQTATAEASTMAVGENQALAFVLYCLITLGSLVGGGIVLALIFRFLDQKVAEVKQE